MLIGGRGGISPVKFMKKIERKKCLHHNHHDRRRILECNFFFFGGLLYLSSGFLDVRVVFRIVVERVDILIAINFYLHSNFTVQMARLGDSRPCH